MMCGGYTPTDDRPEWLNAVLIDSHRSNLIRKDPDYYGRFGWNVPDNLPYIWPVN